MTRALTILLALTVLTVDSSSAAPTEPPSRDAWENPVYAQSKSVQLNVAGSEFALPVYGADVVFRPLGKTVDWKVAGSLPPRKRSVVVTFPNEGRYETALRIDSASEVQPLGIVVVDTTSPSITLAIGGVDDQWLQADIKIADRSIDVDSLQVKVLDFVGPSKRKRERQSETRFIEQPGLLRVVTRWNRADIGEGETRVSVEVADKAGHTARVVREVKAEALHQHGPIRLVGNEELVAPPLPKPLDIESPSIFPKPAPIRADGPDPSAGKSGVGELKTEPTPFTAPPVDSVSSQRSSPAKPKRIAVQIETEPAPTSPTVPSPTFPVLDAEAVQRRDILLRSARNAVALGELDRAIERFEALLQIDPNAVEARAEYAGLLVQTGRVDEAKAEYYSLIDQSTEPDEYRIALADLYIGESEFAAAQELLHPLLDSPEYRQEAAVKLAKTHAWQKEFDEALGIYDEYLSGLTDMSPEDAKEISQLLMEMDRPGEALTILIPLSERLPTDEAVRAAIVLAHTRTGARSAAMSAIEALSVVELKDSGVWLELAQQLYREFAFVEAAAVFDLTSVNFTGTTTARIGLARSYLRVYQTVAARSLLAEVAPVAAGDRYFQIVLADYHTVVGEYSEALAIGHDLLRRNPADVEGVILLGNAYRASRRFFNADRAYQHGLASPEASVDQRREIEWLVARNAFEARRFDAAEQRLLGLLQQFPEDVASILLLVETLVEVHRYDEAEALILGVLPRLERRDAYSLHRALGDVLLERGQTAEAIREYEHGLAQRDLITPAMAYGLFRAHQAMGNQDRVAGAMNLGPTRFQPDATWAIETARLAIRDCDCQLAEKILRNFLTTSPGNLPAQLLLGAAISQCDGCCKLPVDRSGCGRDECGGAGCRACATAKRRSSFPHGGCRSGNCGRGHCTTGCGGPGRLTPPSCGPFGCHVSDGGNPAAIPFSSAIAASPTNIEAHLGLARSLVKHQQYPQALATYAKVRKLVPDDVNVQREVARVVDGWKGYEDAEPLYAQPQPRRRVTDAPIQPVAYEATGPHAIDALGLGIVPPSPTAFNSSPLHGGGYLTGPSTPFVSNAIDELGDEQALIATESEAKWLRGFRNQQAIRHYEGILELEPTNEEALFDLAQIHASQRNSYCAIETYERLFQVNPCHREAAIAWERELLELRPQLLLGVNYLSQSGRDGLADIRRGDYSVVGRFPFGNADEYIDVGYRATNLRLSDDRDNNGNALLLGGQKRLRPNWWLFGDLAIEEYDFGFSTRPTFVAGTRYRTSEELVFEFAGLLDNVATNGEAVRQDIYKAGIQATAAWRPVRPLDLGAYYRWFDYSDDNTANEFGFEAAYRLIDGKQRLRLIGNYDFISFREQSVIPAPPSIVGTTHPYFAPDAFSFITAGLEWKQWLSCDRFKGADEFYYVLYAGARFDSESDSYFLFRGDFNYDIRNWLTWKTGVGVTSSPAFDETVFSTNLIIRFR